MLTAHETTVDEVQRRIKRYDNTYSDLSTIKNALISLQNSDFDKKIERLKNCSNYLEYQCSTTTNQVKLSKANFCELYNLCPICASIRQAKIASHYSQAIKTVINQHSYLKPFFITLTIRVGNSLQERLRSFKDVLHRISLKIKQTRRWESLSEFKKFEGYLVRVEYKQTKTKKWNVHAHLIVLAESIDFQQLREEYQVLSCSKSIDIRLIRNENIKKVLNYMFKPAFYLKNPKEQEDLPEVLNTVLTDIEPRTRFMRAGGLLRSLARNIETEKHSTQHYQIKKYARLGGEYIALSM